MLKNQAKNMVFCFFESNYEDMSSPVKTYQKNILKSKKILKFFFCFENNFVGISNSCEIYQGIAKKRKNREISLFFTLSLWLEDTLAKCVL